MLLFALGLLGCSAVRPSAPPAWPADEAVKLYAVCELKTFDPPFCFCFQGALRSLSPDPRQPLTQEKVVQAAKACESVRRPVQSLSEGSDA